MIYYIYNYIYSVYIYIHMYIYMMCLCHIHVSNIVKEVVSFQEISQLMGGM